MEWIRRKYFESPEKKRRRKQRELDRQNKIVHQIAYKKVLQALWLQAVQQQQVETLVDLMNQRFVHHKFSGERSPRKYMDIPESKKAAAC